MLESETRRALLIGAAKGALILSAIPAVAALDACSSTVTFAQVQAYAAAAVSTLDKLAPLIEVADPAQAAQIQAIVKQADAAEAAFAAMSGPTNAASTAQIIITLVEDGLAIASTVPGLPPTTVAAITAAEILLAAVGGFFSLPVPAPASDSEAVLALRAEALSQYEAASDKAGLANNALTSVRVWLASK